MPVRVQLLARQSKTILHERCALCRRPCEAGVGSNLSFIAGELSGCVCLRCVEAGPRKVARLLRRRAHQVRLLRERCHPCLEAWGWSGLHRLLGEYEAFLNELSETLTHLESWPIAEDPSAYWRG